MHAQTGRADQREGQKARRNDATRQLRDQEAEEIEPDLRIELDSP